MNYHTFVHLSPCSEDQPPVTVTCHDPNATGPMDNYYAETLRDYAAVTFHEALHSLSYLIEGLRYWYELFPPSQEGGGANVD